MTKTPEQVSRAYELLDHLELYPDKHDQNWWIDGTIPHPSSPVGAADVMNGCGTTACAAGWAVLLAGGTFVAGAAVATPDGGGGHVAAAASRILGLTTTEANRLFFWAEDLADVRKEIIEIFGSRPDGAW